MLARLYTKFLQFKHISNYKKINKNVSVKIEQTIDVNGPIEGAQVSAGYFM